MALLLTVGILGSARVNFSVTNTICIRTIMICVMRVSSSILWSGLSRARIRNRKVMMRSSKFITADMRIRMNIIEVFSEKLVISTNPFMD